MRVAKKGVNMMMNLSSIFKPVACLMLAGGYVFAEAKDAPVSEIKMAADLELFYEMGKDTGGSDDSDQFKTQQLYFTVKGEFDGGREAMLKLDAADIVSGDGKVVTEKIVEEANFSLKDVGGLPLTVVFGKDEMPFGQDYDKYLTDPVVHNFEVDKVWGVNAGLAVGKNTMLEAGVYENRNGSPENQMLGNVCARFSMKNIADMLSFEVSGGTESYKLADDAEEDAASLKDESRASAGVICKVGKSASINVEYTAFWNCKGKQDYDPSLVTIGVESRLAEKTTGYARYEKISSDGHDDAEEDFWMVGVGYEAAKGYVLSVEYCNFTSGNLSDTSDLYVAKGKLEDTLKVGVHAMF